MGSVPSISTHPICGGRVTDVELQQDAAVCMLGDQTRLLLSRFLGSRVAIGDEIAFAVPGEDKVGAEILITRHAVSGHNRYFYQAPIGYVTQPKPDKRNEHFVSAEVQGGALGISTIFLPCQALREYFYGLSHSENSPDRPTLYQILRISPNAHAAELRVAFRLRELELTAAGAPRSHRLALERAFNIVGQPELRSCYDALRAESNEILAATNGTSNTVWAVHAGGRTILDAVERALNLGPSALALSRDVLRRYGNMSSATVMFVLGELLRSARTGANGCAMAFGPGLVAETMQFRKAA